MAMRSNKRMIVATGNCGAMADTKSGSIVTRPISWKPLGTDPITLIGYPDAVLRVRQYKNAAMDKIKMTKAFLATMRKKNNRSNKSESI
jgi:hypothetical protein